MRNGVPVRLRCRSRRSRRSRCESRRGFDTHRVSSAIASTHPPPLLPNRGCCSGWDGTGRGQFPIQLGTNSYQNTYFVFFVTVFLCVFSLYFTRISRFAEYTHRIQQNTLYSQEYTRIHTEYAHNTQRAKTPKSALRAIHVLTRQERAKYRRRIRILQNTYFLIVFRAFPCVFCCVFTHVTVPSWHAFALASLPVLEARQPSS